MSEAGVAGLKLMIDDTLEVLRTLTEEEWAAESGCPGWSVKDLINHLAATFTVVIDPTNALDGVTAEVSLEAINDVMVNAGADMSPAEVLASYEGQIDDAVAAVSAVQGPELATVTATLGDVGTYPVHWFANALCFDHLCHLNADVLAPRGPVHRPPVAMDSARLGPSMDWLIAVLPQWSGADLAKAVTEPVDVVLTGAGGRSFQLRPSGTDQVEVALDAGGAETSITSSAADAMTWLTGRTDKGEACTIQGDSELGVAVLAAMRAV